MSSENGNNVYQNQKFKKRIDIWFLTIIMVPGSVMYLGCITIATRDINFWLYPKEPQALSFLFSKNFLK